MTDKGEYGVVANMTEVDAVIRLGAKAWMVNWYSSGTRAEWIALSRGGRVVTKVSPVHRFENFRCAWIPEHLRKHIFICGDRPTMEKEASVWNERADEARKDHPNRKFTTPGTET